MSGFFVPHDLKHPIDGAATGPLAGMNVAIKDMYDITGERTGGGNPDWLATQQPATRNAAAVQRLLDGGARIIGKTVCDEFFYSIAGVNAHYGTPANLRAPGRMPGGSSSGSAAAVAAGACDIGLGSDTGGSIRVPAAFCGLYGIRTTHSRVDTRGSMDMSPTFDTVGWFGASPGPFRLAGQALLGDGRVEAKIAEVIVADDAWAEADAPVAAVLQTVLNRMTVDLPKPRAVRLASGGLDAWREAVRIIQAREIWQVYGRFVTERSPKFGPGVSERMQLAAKITAAETDAARVTMERARDHLRALVKPGTIVAIPSAPCIAPRVDSSAQEQESFRVRTMRITCIAGMGGLPQVSIPAGTVSGCPVGLSLIGWAGGDEALLDAASRLARHVGVEG